jgi:hypothetical protein
MRSFSYHAFHFYSCISFLLLPIAMLQALCLGHNRGGYNANFSFLSCKTPVWSSHRPSLSQRTQIVNCIFHAMQLKHAWEREPILRPCVSICIWNNMARIWNMQARPRVCFCKCCMFGAAQSSIIYILCLFPLWAFHASRIKQTGFACARLASNDPRSAFVCLTHFSAPIALEP